MLVSALAAVNCSAPATGPTVPTSTPASSVHAVPPGLRLPDGVVPLSYALRLELDPEKTVFAGHVDIRVMLDEPKRIVWLHARELALETVTFKTATGAARPLSIVPEKGDEMIGLTAGDPIAPGEYTLSIDYTGTVRDDQLGLFRQRADDRWFLFSQGQAVATRLYVPCFDEPRFKTPWQVTIVAPAGQVALNNAPIASEKNLPDGRHETAFAEIGPLPSYLVALAVGPFAFIDEGPVGKGNTPFRIAAFPSDASRKSMLRGRVDKMVRYLEDYTGRPMPWPKLDFVAVPEFFGAMENIGLVTFESEILFDTSPGEFTFARVAAHELAHQWFGNLVTPAWWDDLWLSEAFATFLGDAAASAAGEGDVALARQLARSEALIADAGATPAPLEREITSNTSVDDTFDAVAYQKGAAVLAMYEGFLTPPSFKRLLADVLAKHSFGSLSTADLAAALRFETADTKKPLGPSLLSYVAHRGTPVVELTLDCANHRIVAKSKSEAIVPVCVRYEMGKTDARSCELVAKEASIDLKKCPAWVIGNAGGTGYYEYTGLAPAPLTAMVPAELLAYGSDTAASFSRGEMMAGDAIGIAKKLIAMTDPRARLGAIAILRAVDLVIDDEQRPAWRKWLVVKLTAAAKGTRAPGHSTIGLPAASAAEALSESVGDLMGPALLGRRAVDQLIELARGTSDRPQASMLESLAAAAPDAVPAVVDLVAEGKLPSAHTLPPLLTLFERPDVRVAAWTAVNEHIDTVLRALTPVDRRTLLSATAQLCDAKSRADVEAAFRPRLGQIPDGAALLATSLGTIDRCIGVRQTAGDVAKSLTP
ncbi:MAG TPA: M1 family metallopeptidase [Kofleriaceae bacterium]|jgi:alanyl aminopeptidase